jgi:Fe-S-cluster containining protein
MDSRPDPGRTQAAVTEPENFILHEYKQLLQKADEWFCSLREKYAGKVRCGRGCSGCCYGLFDISLPDAFVVAAAFGALPEKIRSTVLHSALQIQEKIREPLDEVSQPFLLHTFSQDRIDEIVNSIADVRCPFLGPSDECLIYHQRPLACRLKGFPMVDARDGLFGDWCELNFTEGLPPESARDLCLDYCELEAIERQATRSLSEKLLGRKLDDVTVFIPSVIASRHFME